MLGWSIGFFILSVVAGYFGFSGVETTLAGLAQVLFFLFMALFVLSMLVGLVAGGDRGGLALTGPGRAVGLLMLVAVIATGVYAWVDNGWSAERVGRAIDRRAAEVSADASGAIDEARARTQRFVSRSGADLQRHTDELVTDKAADEDKSGAPREHAKE